MSEYAIRAQELGKEYKLGVKVQKYRTLGDSVVGMLSRSARAVVRRRGEAKSEGKVWALRDVSFDIRRGEVVGLVGRNGAGKSTLLKVLSRITEPTTGWAELHGRVGSLLEVGTGFHPELSGRENVFLNGAILGMHRTEIQRQFDEIVEFAGVAKFIDTPVKHYSSGMYLRLAFAVAAHLEPEILLVDEVLAVGDSEFQRKCLGKMESVAQEGRTVLFVSHNMAAVRSLCSRGILIERGGVGYDGDVAGAIHRYTQSLQTPGDPEGDSLVAFGNLALRGSPTGIVAPGEPFTVACQIAIRQPIPRFRVFAVMHDGNGDIVVHSTAHSQSMPGGGMPGTYAVELRIPPLWLRPGAYSLHFKVVASAFEGRKGRLVSDSLLVDIGGEIRPDSDRGYLVPPLEWQWSEGRAG